MLSLQTEPLLNVVTHALEEKKAIDIKVLDVRNVSNFTDILVVASGSSHRQVSALAYHVIEQVKDYGQRPLGEQGREGGEWALVDLGTIVVHVMHPQIRDFYQLEKLWSDMSSHEQNPLIM